MANAIVTQLRGSGRNLAGQVDLIATMYFAGADCPDRIEGQPFEYTVRLPSGYTLADLKSGMWNAASAQATALGLSLASTDVEMPVFGHGGHMVLARGEATLVLGTVSVSVPGIPSDAAVILSAKSLLGTVTALGWTLNPGVGFTITSLSILNISVVSWIVVV